MSRGSWQAARAVFLAAIMVTSVFAAGIAFSGSAAAEVAAVENIEAEDVSGGQETETQNVTLINVTGNGTGGVITEGNTDDGITITDATITDPGQFDDSNTVATAFPEEPQGAFQVNINESTQVTSNISVRLTLNTTNAAGPTANYSSSGFDTAELATTQFTIAESSDETTESDNVLTVDPDGTNGEFDTIQEAVNNAEQNDTVEITTGTYREAVVANVTGLTLEAAEGADPVIKNGPLEGDSTEGGSIAAGGDAMINASADDVTVRGLTVETQPSDGAPPAGIRLNGDGSAAINNTVSHNEDPSGNVPLAGAGDAVTIEDNTVTNGPVAYYASGSADIIGNTIEGEIVNEGIWITTSGELTVQNNNLSEATVGVGTQGVETGVKFTESDVTVNGETVSDDILTTVGEDNTGTDTVEIAGDLLATGGTLTVEDGESIQNAVDTVDAFDNTNTVEAAAGVYDGFEITTRNVTVTGQRNDTVIEGLVYLKAQETELREVRVDPPTFGTINDNNENQAVLVSASDATVDDAIVDIDVDVEVSGDTAYEEIQAVQVFASDDSPISDVVVSDNAIVGTGTQSDDALVGVVGVNDQGNTTDTLIVNNDIDVASEGYSFGVVTRASRGNNAVGTPSSEVLFNDITAIGGTLNGVGYGIESTSNDGAGSNGAQVDAEDQQVKYNHFENIDSIEHKSASGRLDLTVNKWEDPDDVQFLTDAFDSDIQDGGEIVYDPVLTEEKSVNRFDELVTENENGEIFATTRDYSSYIELETEGEPAVIGFPAPPAAPLGELISNETLQVEGKGVNLFIYDNQKQEFEEANGSTVPEAGEVLVITTGGDPISGDLVVPVDTEPNERIATPSQTPVSEGWNLVATGAVNSRSDVDITSEIDIAGTFQTQPAQPGAPPASTKAYSGVWIFVKDDGILTPGYVPDQPPFVYTEGVLTPAPGDEESSADS